MRKCGPPRHVSITRVNELRLLGKDAGGAQIQIQRSRKQSASTIQLVRFHLSKAEVAVTNR